MAEPILHGALGLKKKNKHDIRSHIDIIPIEYQVYTMELYHIEVGCRAYLIIHNVHHLPQMHISKNRRVFSEARMPDQYLIH